MMVDFNSMDANYTYTANVHPHQITFFNDSKEVIRIDPQGRIFWKNREVESDAVFREAMLELASIWKRNTYGYVCSEDEAKYWYNKGHNDGRNLRT